MFMFTKYKKKRYLCKLLPLIVVVVVLCVVEVVLAGYARSTAAGIAHRSLDRDGGNGDKAITSTTRAVLRDVVAIAVAFGSACSCGIIVSI